MVSPTKRATLLSQSSISGWRLTFLTDQISWSGLTCAFPIDVTSGSLLGMRGIIQLGLFEVESVEVERLVVLIEIGENEKAVTARGRVDEAGIKGTGVDDCGVESIVFEDGDFAVVGTD